MSSLMVSHDLRIMMLELAVNSVYVPWKTVFDRVILKKTGVMFRILDDDWTTLFPQGADGSPYRGSNRELDLFHGGNSVIFSVPGTTLEDDVNGVELQLCVYKEICKHFEMDSSQNVGFLLLRVDDLFNGIVKELRERKELADYLSTRYQRQPVSRSLKGKYPLMSEALGLSGASIDLYVRLSYLGKCVVTEIDLTDFECKAFHAKEERSAGNPYECRELTGEDIRAGRSMESSAPIRPPPDARRRLLTCQCDRLDDRPEGVRGVQKIPRELAPARGQEEVEREEDEDAADLGEEAARGKKKGKERKEKKQGKGKEKRENGEEAEAKDQKRDREKEKQPREKKKDDGEERQSRGRKQEENEENQAKEERKENADPREYKGKRKVNMESKGGKNSQGRATNMGKVGKKIYNPGRKVAEQKENTNNSKKESFRLDAEFQDILALIMSNRRRGGTVTVGIQDNKKKKICPPRVPKLPTCQPCCIPVHCYKPACFI